MAKFKVVKEYVGTNCISAAKAMRRMLHNFADNGSLEITASGPWQVGDSGLTTNPKDYIVDDLGRKYVQHGTANLLPGTQSKLKMTFTVDGELIQS